MNNKTFADLGLSEAILAAIEKKGFEKPSPIQAGVIPLLLNGDKDIIGQAQTGTGKTAAFALPLLERLDPTANETQAIILAPTRELASQVAKEIESFSVPQSPTVTVVYGGNPMQKEIKALKKKPSIVVGTPGRMQHHIRNKNLKMGGIKYFVLDEADEMLNFGFREEIEEVLNLTPKDRKVLLFSATMPQSILRIVHKYMKDHDTVKVAAKEMTNENITQKYYCVAPRDKFEALSQIMEDEETFYAIVFCRTKADTDFVASQLSAKHLKAAAIHGDVDQSQRERILRKFKERRINILVATDVAARGIDVNDLTFVVNYSMPENYEIYTHRIGRTGRAGNKGTAITFVGGREMHRLRFFEKNLKVKMEKGVLPKPAELVAKKKQHLIERLEHIVNNENTDALQDLAQILLEEGNPVETIAALLKDAYPGDFDVSAYKVIPDDSSAAGSRSRSKGGRYKGGRSGGYKGRNKGGYNKGGRNGSSYKSKSRGNSSYGKKNGKGGRSDGKKSGYKKKKY